MGIISAKEYAAHRGVSAQAVSKAIKTGRLSAALVVGLGKKPKIDSEIADREWSSKSDPSKVRELVPEKNGNTPAMAFGLPHGESESSAPAPIDYQNARASREHYQAEISRLEFEEKIGKLIPSEEVGRKWNALAALVRQKVIAIAHKSKQRIPELSLEQVAILESLAREALEDLAAAGSAEEELAVSNG